MFRLVSIALVTTFAALALVGGEAPANKATLTGYGIVPERITPLRTSERPHLPPVLYVATPKTELLDRPDYAASILRELPLGAELVPVASQGRFFQVRDAAGRVGYVAAGLVATDAPV